MWRTRLMLVGGMLGAGVAGWCIWPQAIADLRGQNIMGPGEAMFVLSLPVSFVTWLGWLLPASALFGSSWGAIPRWVFFTWMAITPPLNWGFIGWLIGRSLDRSASNKRTRAAV